MNKLFRFCYQKSTLIVAICLTILSFSCLFLVLMDMGISESKELLWDVTVLG